MQLDHAAVLAAPDWFGMTKSCALPAPGEAQERTTVCHWCCTECFFVGMAVPRGLASALVLP